MTKRQIENSLDYKTYGRTIKTLVAMWAVFAVLVLFVMAFVLMPTTNVGVVFLYAVALSVGAGILAISGPVIYCIVKRARMLKNIDEYKVYSAVLDKPHVYRGSVRYEVCLPYDDSKDITLNTPYMFGSGMFAVNLVDDYNNKKVNLAYNGKTGVLVVLGLADEPLVEPADTSEIE